MICPGCLAENEPGVDVCLACGRSLTALTRGSVLASRYEIRNLLGRGGMGVVYEAHDRLLDETVAIKVLRADFGGSEEMVRRFRSEIKLARKVSHANVCRIHDYGEASGLVYISMALLRGRDLRSVLREHRQGLPPEQAFEMAIQACAGLAAIHDVGIIHRDLKTANIMLEPDGKALLMDFGIAKEAALAGTGLTLAGQVMGTPEYMSPEQCLGDELDLRSDVYAMGVVVWELFTGEVPFRGDTVMGTLFKHLEETPPFDGPSGERLPPALVLVLRKALAKDAEDRYATAGELLQGLRAAREAFARGERAAAGASGTSGLPPTAEKRGTREVGPQAGWGPDAPTLPPLPDLPPLPSFAPPPTVALSRPEVPPAVTPRPPEVERRRHDRLIVPVDVQLRWLGPSGAVLQQERTITEALGRDGASVFTAMGQVRIGETVEIEEVGGDFRTRAIVRDVRVEADHRRRLGIEFLDHPLPERFLPADYSTPHSGAARAATRAATPMATPPERPAGPAGEPAPAARSEAAPQPEATPPMSAAAAEAARPDTPQSERREHSRLGIHIELRLRRLGPDGQPVQEERTVAEDVSRGGLRVLTSLAEVAEGDVVEVEEVDGDFKTRARVVSRRIGRDRIPRLGVQFIDRQAPDRLVAEGERRASGHTKRLERGAARAGTEQAGDGGGAERGKEAAAPGRSAATSQAATPGPLSAAASAPAPSASAAERRREILAAYEGIATLNHFEFLGLPRASTDADVKKAYFEGVRKFHPDTARDPALADLGRELSAVFVHLGKVYEVLSHRERRFEYEGKLGRETKRPAAAGAGGPGAAAPAAGASASPTPAEAARETEAAFARAVALNDDGKHWDAIKLLEWVVGRSADPALRVKARLLMAEAVVQNPRWRRRGEELLLDILKEEPQHAGARLALGRLYAESGLRSRAEREFRKVLELVPRQKDAVKALKALDHGEAPPAGKPF